MLNRVFLFITAISQFILNTSIHASEQEKSMAHSLARLLGAPDTPTKSVGEKVLTGGVGVIEQVKQRHDQETDRLRQIEEEKRAKIAIELHEERTKRAEDMVSQKQEKEAIIRMAEEHLKQEREANLKKQAEIDNMKIMLNIKEQEVLASRRALASAEDQMRTLMSKIDSHAGATSEASQREIEELQQLLEKERAKKREECEVDIREQLQAVSQERDDLLNLLNTMRGGQTLTLTQDNFIKYSDFHIHDKDLKPLDTSFDAVLKGKLEVIISSIQTLDKEIQSNNKLKPVHKMVARQQLRGVHEAAKEFEMSTFSRAYSEAQQSPHLADSKALKEIEEMMLWFKDNEKDLLQMGQQKIYIERQQQLRKAFEENYGVFASFYQDYLDRVLVVDLIWLLPSANDDEPTKNAKQTLLVEVNSGSLAKLRDHVYGKLPIFGDSNVFYTRTFVRYIKEYDALKKVIEGYAGMFRGLGELAKLTEDLLNYHFFQLQFQACFADIKSIELKKINDAPVREILKEIQQGEVLNYNETKVTVFAAKVEQACKEYLNKKAVMRPEEKVLEPLVRKALNSYQLLNVYAQKLRAGNPRIAHFHRKK